MAFRDMPLFTFMEEAADEGWPELSKRVGEYH